MKILILNAGSSSHKFSLFDITNSLPTQPLWRGSLDWGQAQGKEILLSAKTVKSSLQKTLYQNSIEEAFYLLLNTLTDDGTGVLHSLDEIDAIGHRVVHGGSVFQSPVIISQQIEDQITQLIPLAPLHNPANLAGIRLCKQLCPQTPQVAVFDTAFHRTLPPEVKTYPIPLALYDQGIQRYGFHGISHHYCLERVATLLNRPIDSFKMINCHLGNGASLCAIDQGKSVDTTMGFTPLEGLMMGTRCGSIDPGILFYLMDSMGEGIEKVKEMLNFESGLKGIAGSSDMRELLQSRNTYSELAVKMFTYRLRAFIGAFAASLGGIDVISFTGGIGEFAAPVREKALQGLSFMGISLDKHLNDSCSADQIISPPGSSVTIYVLHTEEEWMIAKDCFTLLSSSDDLSLQRSEN